MEVRPTVAPRKVPAIRKGKGKIRMVRVRENKSSLTVVSGLGLASGDSQ